MSFSKRAAGGLYITLALLLIAGAVIFFAVMGMNERNANAGTTRNTESKTDLHDIQVAIEKYAEDHCGNYPGWLIGGEARYAATVDTADPRNPFQEITECPKLHSISDPLLREGYLTAYPRNPFVRHGVGVHETQCRLSSGDKLRNGHEYAEKLGTRFGAQCNLLGNVLADLRFYEWTAIDPETNIWDPERTYADIDYHYWDMHQFEPPVPHLAGQFFYKSNWRLVPPELPQMARTMEIDDGEPSMYMLGSYGVVGEKGQDVFGTEQMVKFDMGDDGELLRRPWTGSARSDSRAREGCPYGPPAEGTTDQFSFGNPNGIADSVVLVLTGHDGQM